MGRGLCQRRLSSLLVGVFKARPLIAIQRLFLDLPRQANPSHDAAYRAATRPAAFAGGAMRIAEGFETACAYRQITGREAGTCFGVRNFGGFAVGDSIEQVILLPDNDREGCKRRNRPSWLANLPPCPSPSSVVRQASTTGRR
jgi:hypothetical protein